MAVAANNCVHELSERLSGSEGREKALVCARHKDELERHDFRGARGRRDGHFKNRKQLQAGRQTFLGIECPRVSQAPVFSRLAGDEGSSQTSTGKEDQAVRRASACINDGSGQTDYAIADAGD